MKVTVNLSALRRTHGYEHLIRFVLGGALTALTGLIAQKWGATVGGLFLAFPAIFPASAILLDKHEREKKRKAGITRTLRGRLAVALDARGAAMGSIALAAFALLVWKTLPSRNAIAVEGGALLLWVVIATALWRVRKLHVYFSRRH